MDSTVDASGEPIPTSSVLMAAAKHIGIRCRGENIAFLKCKKDDPNPEKCLDKGRQVTECVLHLGFLHGPYMTPHLERQIRLRDLHQNCNKEMDAYAGCMYYHTNEFELCRKEQQSFEKACPF
ncbi:NADH dehydrogenase [ubiquinone] 1 alpha subcomplex subunit 8-B-like isoform X1 [Salvia miltiorrhiza]|uniref:NADH dehydrogenase [ubiquinone] 1 alpha subcomplex subunit 8-B-like isoform X1 n=1 Tax=Salvia miltiorrhiza TaxID=226208 RepID=UPI0025ABAF6D|nr:NADH dehydrogenase [ubiquinone] 1 alpha subcomplex subunit 8-B-like isoform X1 [Salvia miltiorrhiza]